MRVDCEYCNFRGLPISVKMHTSSRHAKEMTRNPTPEPAKKVDIKPAETTPSGRIRRHAASKATLNVANAIKELKSGK